MTSVFTVIQDASSLSFKFRSVLSVSSREWDVGCGGRLSGLATWLLELGEELGRSALGRAVGEMED
jgi:hypothetical protein